MVRGKVAVQSHICTSCDQLLEDDSPLFTHQPSEMRTQPKPNRRVIAQPIASEQEAERLRSTG
jgi:hypothetical protein